MKTTGQYMMLLRNTDWDEGLSVEETGVLIEKYTVWFDHMVAAGKVAGGAPLLASGRVVSKDGAVISDGPFIEAKEAIGGYITLNAADYEEAVALARTFPPVELGVAVEIREVAATCPVSLRLEERLARKATSAGA